MNERAGVNNHRANSTPTPSLDYLASSLPIISSSISMAQNTSNNTQPPPVPSRQQPQQQNTIAPYISNFGYPYSTAYNGMYGGYGGFGGYYNRYGDDGGFAQQAELSTRQAFQSVETIVRAFGSIAMMLDSTYQAVFNSFRAIIGMADQFSRLRLQMSHVFNTLAFFRLLKYILKKIRYIMRRLKLGQKLATNEELWEDCIGRCNLSEDSKMTDGQNSHSPMWPIVLFFAIVMGGPWLLWKLFNNFGNYNSKKRPDWLNGLSDSYIGLAEFDFQARNVDELSFKKGTKVVIAPQDHQPPSIKGWLLASVDKQNIGLIPLNYVKVVAKNKGQNSLAVTKANANNDNLQNSKTDKGSFSKQEECGNQPNLKCNVESNTNNKELKELTSIDNKTKQENVCSNIIHHNNKISEFPESNQTNNETEKDNGSLVIQ